MKPNREEDVFEAALGSKTLQRIATGRGELLRHRLPKIVSVEHRFIWQWIPKNAGGSIWRSLCDAGGIGCQQTFEELYRLRPDLRDFETIAFVRNPFTRVVSCWLNKIAVPSYSPSRLQDYPGLEPGMSFEAFCKWLGSDAGSDRNADPHWQSQHLMLEGIKTFLPFEDLPEVVSRLGLDPVALPHRNSHRRMLELGGMPQRELMDWHTPETLDLIARRYAADLELFGYDIPEVAFRARDVEAPARSESEDAPAPADHAGDDYSEDAPAPADHAGDHYSEDASASADRAGDDYSEDASASADRAGDDYDAIWKKVAAIAEPHLMEQNLSRAVRLTEAEWRAPLNESKATGIAFGRPVVLPRGALVTGRQMFRARYIADHARKASAVAELGSGWGQNLFDVYLSGGPRTPYIGMEISENGRALAERFAALDSDLEFISAAFDYLNADFSAIPPGAAVFTCHSVEQIRELPETVLTGLIARKPGIVIHFEPIGWQIRRGGERAELGATEENALRSRYNQNLWFLLQGLANKGQIEILDVEPDLIAHKHKNASSLVAWRPR